MNTDVLTSILLNPTFCFLFYMCATNCVISLWQYFQSSHSIHTVLLLKNDTTVLKVPYTRNTAATMAEYDCCCVPCQAATFANDTASDATLTGLLTTTDDLAFRSVVSALEHGVVAVGSTCAKVILIEATSA